MSDTYDADDTSETKIHSGWFAILGSTSPTKVPAEQSLSKPHPHVVPRLNGRKAFVVRMRKNGKRRGALSVRHVSKELGISEHAVCARIRRGTILAHMVGSLWFVPRKEMENIRKQEAQRDLRGVYQRGASRS